jgi:hypothetical protein
LCNGVAEVCHVGQGIGAERGQPTGRIRRQ